MSMRAVMPVGARFVAVFVLVVALIPPVPGEAGSGGKSIEFLDAEKCFMRKINAKRNAHGKRPLRWDRQVGYVARRHAREIAGEGGVRHDHNYTKEITNWRRLGQNTGRGNSCDSLFKAFWGSSTHRQNILGRWRYMGVGIHRARGSLYVQQVFESERNPGNIY